MTAREQLGGVEFSRPRPLTSEASIADDDLAYAAKLIRAVGPLAPSEHRRRRVWARLQSTTVSRAWPARRILYVAAACALFAAASSAAIGRYWSTSKDSPEPSGVAPRVANSPAVNAAATPMPAPVPDASVSPPARTTQRSAAVSKVRSTPAEPEPEAALLLRAMKARRQGDTTQVEALAAEYRLKHPDGALGEEALILSIEAAQSLGEPKARALAREYLSRYPRGRFRSQAAHVATTPSR
jgi:hypothetical protein